MRFIRPTIFAPSMLVSSNVPENDYAEWVAGTYPKGTRKILAATHMIYEVLATTTADSPLDGLAKGTPTWMVVSFTNKYKMFDDVIGTQTTNPLKVDVVMRPGTVVNSLALFNLAGKSVTITVTDPVEGVVFNRKISLIRAGVDNWYDWFFEDIDYRTNVVVLDMPAYGTADIRVVVESTGTAAVGILINGKLQTIGTALWDASVGIDDYSRKVRDPTFGTMTVIQRSFSDVGDFPIQVETIRIDKIKKMLTEIRATPVVWVAEEKYESTIIYGFYKTFRFPFSGPDFSQGTISIEGVI